MTTTLSELPAVFGLLGKQITRMIEDEANRLRAELEARQSAQLEAKAKEFAAKELFLLRNVDALQGQLRDLKIKHKEHTEAMTEDFARREIQTLDIHEQEISHEKAETEKFRKTVENQSSVISDQIDQIANLKISEHNLEISVANFRKTTVALEIDNLGLRTKMASVQEDLEISNSRISGLLLSERESNDRLQIANAELDRFRSEMAKLSTKLGNSLNENDKLKEEISNLHRRLDSQDADIQKELKILGERNRELNFRLKQAAEWGAKISSELGNLKKNLENPEILKSQTDILISVIKSLLSSLQSQESEISSLVQKNSDLLIHLDATERELRLERQLLPVMHSPVFFM